MEKGGYYLKTSHSFRKANANYGSWQNITFHIGPLATSNGRQVSISSKPDKYNDPINGN